jgi:hypothetical protein
VPEYHPVELPPVQAFLDEPVEFAELAHVIQTVLAARPHP